ncbi:1,6-anhydro-N-acetylmuramyl-L-alanine amidase AmpD [Zooshikella harenae]|uniref:1,6-anhydro-N-acetylmuramyl-L-alanine amidase AmpD n=1 Tax=Zooshikella harenae TaxID=2827238 RepID=UPI0028156ABC|nr:1,6-anhydro-N-acetylmuramyl-L-alanine amidase AmpD [Zooshikella harenae]
MFKTIESGLIEGATFCPSPNYNNRPAPVTIDLLVIHNISLPPGQYNNNYIRQFFTNQLDPSDHPYFAEISSLKVSAHLLIDRQGEVFQFVHFNKRAWHAGESAFLGQQNCNDFSIGIELEGTDHQPYEVIQYQQLAKITQALMNYYPAISLDRIVGHSDIAPARKTDPGPAFDWKYFKHLLKKNGL